jgi:hypothetical protein
MSNPTDELPGVLTAVRTRPLPMSATVAANDDWINRVLAVGAGHRLANGPVYGVFEVL